MRGSTILTLALAATATATAGASAQERTGYARIAAGDFAGARAELEAESRTYPRRPDLMLNLAAIQRRDGQFAAARDLYRSVLARADAGMDMPDGTVASSHDLAREGLARLNASNTASR